DDDWLWGGDLKAIEYTITHGVRDRTSPETRFSQMPAFGRDGLLTSEQISDVAGYVLTLSGRGEASAATARGAELYANNCAICHGNDGTGSREFGAPNLADAIWLFGRDREVIRQRIHDPMHGVMPAWGGRLDSVTIKMLAAYVHSLGGGEDFVEVARDPAVEVDEQPRRTTRRRWRRQDERSRQPDRRPAGRRRPPARAAPARAPAAADEAVREAQDRSQQADRRPLPPLQVAGDV